MSRKHDLRAWGVSSGQMWHLIFSQVCDDLYVMNISLYWLLRILNQAHQRSEFEWTSFLDYYGVSSLSFTLCVVSTPVLAAPFHHCPTFVYCFSNTHVNRDWHKIPLSQTHTSLHTLSVSQQAGSHKHTLRHFRTREDWILFVYFIFAHICISKEKWKHLFWTTLFIVIDLNPCHLVNCLFPQLWFPIWLWLQGFINPHIVFNS